MKLWCGTLVIIDGTVLLNYERRSYDTSAVLVCIG